MTLDIKENGRSNKEKEEDSAGVISAGLWPVLSTDQAACQLLRQLHSCGQRYHTDTLDYSRHDTSMLPFILKGVLIFTIMLVKY